MWREVYDTLEWFFSRRAVSDYLFPLISGAYIGLVTVRYHTYEQLIKQALNEYDAIIERLAEGEVNPDQLLRGLDRIHTAMAIEGHRQAAEGIGLAKVALRARIDFNDPKRSASLLEQSSIWEKFHQDIRKSKANLWIVFFLPAIYKRMLRFGYWMTDRCLCAVRAIAGWFWETIMTLWKYS